MTPAEIIDAAVSDCIEQEEDGDGNYHNYVSSHVGPHVIAALSAQGYAITRESLCARAGGCQ